MWGFAEGPGCLGVLWPALAAVVPRQRGGQSPGGGAGLLGWGFCNWGCREGMAGSRGASGPRQGHSPELLLLLATAQLLQRAWLERDRKLLWQYGCEGAKKINIHIGVCVFNSYKIAERLSVSLIENSSASCWWKTGVWVGCDKRPLLLNTLLSS